jgi:hypothetical protein
MPTINIREGGGQDQDGRVQVGGTKQGGERGLTHTVSREESDQSVRRSEGCYGLLETVTQMKQTSSGTFTKRSKNIQSVRSRIAEIEELHRDGVK